MEKVIKLPENIIKEITDLQTDFLKVINQLGDIEVSFVNLQSKKDELIKQFKTLKENETILIEKIGKEHGLGKLNLKTGELTINIDDLPQKQN
ncbi:MAG: hypothetical protein JETCAE03_33380 [Ignavibacteriaceae bacterium]|jgi:hypothetical protein|nr:MAG: hypothetical protein JETCAE03_33380 [Ignavibacteriaceae bacterium]